MILPILAYGHPILKKRCGEVHEDHKDLGELIDNMWETMYNAKGVGLAAPQIGLDKRIFIVDTIQLKKKDEDGEEVEKGIKKVFINAQILDEGGDLWAYEEGCLSIPKLTGEVERQEFVTIRYQDGAFNTFEETLTGMNARVVQHEYDHIQGILFTEKLKPLKRRLIMRKLEQIKKGRIEVDYRMKFKQKV